jgi:hypothetical protein
MSRRAALTRAMVVACAVLAMPACARTAADLRADDAANSFRTEAGFTTREQSAVKREFVQILAIRRIGKSSTEVEFTWHDSTPPAGQAVAPLRRSMALFKIQDDGRWRLTSLFRVD